MLKIISVPISVLTFQNFTQFTFQDRHHFRLTPGVQKVRQRRAPLLGNDSLLEEILF